MAIFSALVMFAFTVITALINSGSMTDSMLENEEGRLDKLQILIEQGKNRSKFEEQFRTQISRKLEYIIKNFKPNDILNTCELPVDDNLISTVIGLKVYNNPKYIQKDFYANFRCTDPGSFQFFGGSTNIRCNGINSDQTASPYCVQLKNETEWKDDMLQLNENRRRCLDSFSSINRSEVLKDPLSPTNYLQCLYKNGSTNYEFVRKSCHSYYYVYFDNNLKLCKSSLDANTSGLQIRARYKPSIIVDASNSAWDSMGWLLVEKGSKVTLDCIYPKVTGKTDVTWYKISNENGYGSYGVAQNSSQWISDYRNRIVLNEVDYIDTGFYTCEGKYKASMHLQIYSHSVAIALKEKECPEFPLPDFKLHQRYYRKFPVMNRVKRWCQRNRKMGSSQKTIEHDALL